MDSLEARAGASEGLATRAGARAAESARRAAALAADPKFKKYTAQVERCLQTFDNAHEWADFIAFLTKLLKTLQMYIQFKDVPRKLVVAKRLAQCLNPALPTGVHQRALDVYAHVLAVIGTEGLRRDLQLWSAGLFPFFEYAATSVKPTLLNVFDTHYLPLQDSLRPVMKALILALLPGLEEETGEFFDKVLSLLDRLSGTVYPAPAFFFQNVWLVMIMMPSARGSALNFLARRLPKLNGEEDVAPIVGRDMGLMIRAFAAALEDEDLLVRRRALDLLVQALPVSSSALRNAQEPDQRILMRAATNVVLRRDLSLNRRLYAWLLGPGADGAQPQPQPQPQPSSPSPSAFFREHALELLRRTLQEDLPDARAFKVFVSLLDRWELGVPLVEVLLYDALRTVKAQEDADLLMAANTLYDAVEPLAVWKQLFAAVRLELVGLHGAAAGTSAARFEGMAMVKFVLTRLRVQDDEVQEVHLPRVFAAVLELLKAGTLVEEDPSRLAADALYEALQLLAEMARHVPTGALTRSERTAGDANRVGPYAHACEFYGVAPDTQGPPRSDVLFVTAFEDLVALSAAYARAVVTHGAASPRMLRSFVETLNMLAGLVGQLGEKQAEGLPLEWAPAEWLACVLATLQDSSSFVVVDTVVSTVVALSGSVGLFPRLAIDERGTVFKMVNALFSFLRVESAPYHVRAVSLIWMLEHATACRHVESIVAQGLTSPESRNVHEAYDAFGVLWRLTDDSLLPGFRFKVPMLLVLDTLKSHDPHLRRVGETWMRCNLKSYTRVLEPLLYDLLDPSVLGAPSIVTLNGREIPGCVYRQRLDQRRVEHMLETLLSLVKFGGQGFGRVARGAQVKKSNHPGLVERVDSAKMVAPEATYLDVLLEILLRLLRSEPLERLVPFMGHANAQIQANSIDLIQTIVARGELEGPGLEAVENAIVGKLYISVHLDRVDLQNKLLHVLHSIISASSTHRSKDGSGRHGDASAQADDGAATEDTGRAAHVNQLLTQTLMDGISTAAGRPTLQHWVDFVLMTVPQFSNALSYLIPPLSECVCQQLRRAIVDVKRVLNHGSTVSGSIVSGTTDAEFIILLNALERLVLLILAKSHDTPTSEEEPASERQVPETSSSGILGIVSNVFSSESTGPSPEDYLSPRSPGYQALHDAVRVLYSLWVLTGSISDVSNVSEAETLTLILTRARIRGRKVLERLFRARASEVMESVIECWFQGILEHEDKGVAFEIVDVLASSSQAVVHMLCESITCRVAGPDKTRKSVVNPNLSDVVVFSFLEEYLSRLEGPLVVQVWSRCLMLAKEILSNVNGYKLQLFPTLRCITVLADKITQTTAIDDRKTRKELQDNFVKLVDNVTLIVGRSFDQGNWIRRSTKESLNVNDGSPPLPRSVSDGALDEKTVPAQTDGAVPGLDPIATIDFMGSYVLSNLRRTLFDNDKIAGICTNLVYYVVTPALKKSSRALDVDESILEILRELSKLPPSAKAWRSPVSEAFNDNRFFNSTPAASQKWRPVICALMDTDRQAFPELLGKITSTGSTNIFANREYETMIRSLNLRRLSYVVFAGEKNHFLTQLPSIQEKLVDILRNANPPSMQSEVYLCLRVLLCRLSPHNLSSFWPVILTELLRIFDQITTEPPADGSEDLRVILSASKFLDLVLTLQTEEFQIHQWMFVTDTVDAVYRPDAWSPEALLDQLAEIISDLPFPSPRESKTDDIEATTLIRYGRLDSAISYNESPTVAMRRPLLSSVRQIDSIRDLLPFFSHVSIASYEGVYHCAGIVDWNAIEESLLGEMFDGR